MKFIYVAVLLLVGCSEAPKPAGVVSHGTIPAESIAKEPDQAQVARDINERSAALQRGRDELDVKKTPTTVTCVKADISTSCNVN
nr:hypothetical protein [uncultured Undibacterium sp.]